jgi:threonine/homoserine/homoserine lactone efflux protein
MHTSVSVDDILFFSVAVLGFAAYISWIAIQGIRGWKREQRYSKAEKQIQKVLGTDWTLDEILQREG